MADVLVVVFSGLAFVVAAFALLLGAASFRRDHTPLLRPVRHRDLSRILIKNIGRGPAVGVVLMDSALSQILLIVDAVEPLGEGTQEHTRIGRVNRAVSQALGCER
jgi:hypothetical protein